MFNVFITCLFICSRYRFLYMLSDSDLMIYMDYYRSFTFLYVTCYCLYLHAWTTSLDHVHVCLICTPLGFIICTSGVASDSPGFLCLDPRDRTVVTLLWLIRVRSGSFCDDQSTTEAWTRRGFSSQFLSCLLPRPSCYSWAPLSFCISLHVLYFDIFWWCNWKHLEGGWIGVSANLVN